MKKTIMSIVEEAFKKHCDDEDLIREVIEGLVHAFAQLKGEDGLQEIITYIETEKKRIYG